MPEFPARQWKRQTLYDLVRKIDQTGSTDRLIGSGRPRSVRTAAKSRTAETFPVTLRRIFNNRLKKLSLIVFCCNFWTVQHKPHDYICSGSKNMVSQKCAVFIGPPCRPIYDTADTQLYTKILHNPYHFLQALLTTSTSRKSQSYSRYSVWKLQSFGSHLPWKTFHVGMKSGFLKPRVHLCFSKVELRGKFDALRSWQVLLWSKALFETVQLLITEDRPRFASSTAGHVASVMQFECCSCWTHAHWWRRQVAQLGSKESW